jgi:hypothetical protein
VKYLAFILFILPSAIQACSCIGFENEYLDEVSDYVVIGKIKAKSSFLSWTKDKYEIEVSKTYKGAKNNVASV